MAGYWPSSFFAFLVDRDEVEVHKNAKKKERGQCPAILTEQACPIKDLLYGQKVTPLKYLLQRAGECVHSCFSKSSVVNLFSYI